MCIRDSYKTADIFCAPATGQESFGIVLLEAMAAGTAIAASRIEGFSNVVEDDRNSIMFSPKDVESLRNVLTKLISDQKLRDRLSRSGSIDVFRYNWDTVASEVVDYYQQLGAISPELDVINLTTG